MFNILVTDPLPEEGLAVLRAAPDVHLDYANSQHALFFSDLGRYDALIVRSGTAVSHDLMAQATRLKIIGRAGVNVDNIDISAATERGIMVMNTPEAASIAAAEHTLALLLALCRHIPQADAAVRRGEWERNRFLGVQLAGQTLGLIGLGRVGRRVAESARALDMRVLAYDPYVEPDVARAREVTLVTLDELLARADVVSVHANLHPGTVNLLGARELAQMKPGAWLVNTAHADMVNEAALAEALNRGHLAGAALDVFPTEPPTRTGALWSAPQVVFTPRLSSSTQQAQRAVAVQIAEQVLDALRGHNYHNVVNLPFVAGPNFALARPYMALAEKMGRLQSALAGGRIIEVALEVKGEGMADLVRPMAVGVLTGLLAGELGESVNYINAPGLAHERGIRTTQTRGLPLADYVNLLSCRVRWQTPEGITQERLMAGTLFGGREGRIVQMDDFHMEARPQGHGLFMLSKDVPGVIGIVGTLLFQYGINIAEWRLGRDTPGGTAISFINVDEAVPEKALAALRALPQMVEARAVWMGE